MTGINRLSRNPHPLRFGCSVGDFSLFTAAFSLGYESQLNCRTDEDFENKQDVQLRTGVDMTKCRISGLICGFLGATLVECCWTLQMIAFSIRNAKLSSVMEAAIF